MLLTFILLICLIIGFFLFKGIQSRKLAPPELHGGVLPVCGVKPNCVCSLQDPLDEHFIEAIDLRANKSAEVISAIESIGGKITTDDDTTIQATFTSGLFRFVDDLAVQINGGKLDVRSSSRVGHSDLGANRRRIERLRKALS